MLWPGLNKFRRERVWFLFFNPPMLKVTPVNALMGRWHANRSQETPDPAVSPRDSPRSGSVGHQTWLGTLNNTIQTNQCRNHHMQCDETKARVILLGHATQAGKSLGNILIVLKLNP